MEDMGILLVGLGHEMHGDDEIGLEVVRAWTEKYGEKNPTVQTALLESPGLNLLGTLAGREAAILVAALRSGARLGTVRILKMEELSFDHGSSRKISAWGAAESLSLGRELAPEELPEKLVLIGIEGASFGLGEGLSPAVRASIPEAMKSLNQILKDLGRKKFNIKKIIQWVTSILTKSKPPG